MKEIKTLMLRARSTIKSAGLLLREGDFDSSVSRSYYAMFYATEAVLLTKEVDFSSHKSVISLFGKHFVKPGIFDSQMGRRLSKTFEKRLVGDYSFAPEISEGDAEKVLNWAKDFIEEINNYLLKNNHIE
jgi:uncharacterized protein (UPF0332 family)